MKKASAILLTIMAVTVPSGLLTNAWADDERWAAIVGSSDRSAVGWATNEDSRYDAIDLARINCRKRAESDQSCNIVRKAWEGSHCESVFIAGEYRSVCND